MHCEALAGLGSGDQEYAIHAVECRGDRRGVVIVEVRRADAPRGEVGDLRGGACARDDVGRGDAAAEERVDDEVAEVPTGTGDENGHERSFRSVP